ncbi:MAG: ATP-binding cassette domain-containing protein [Candidatus Heimdallarchaeota archaeon]|nr:ATP-binding cassette domain-containing protein [Candidatus Heimdallarchaeota archaeon]
MTTVRTLRAIELTKIFPHPYKKDVHIPLFAAASFQIDAKKVNFLVGISGSGKTTLLRIISGLEGINAGELYLDEMAIHNLGGKEKLRYLRSLGFLDQFPAKYLSMNLSVFQNLEQTLILYCKLQREVRKKKINELISNLNINNLRDKKLRHLSGGELRRVGFACSIVFTPSILLCDEPTAQLDTENKQIVLETIQKAHELYEMLIIVTTHNHSIIGKNPLFEIDERRVIRRQ